jgi:hypothetical protein
MRYSSNLQILTFYKARERSLHERANMIHGEKEEKAIEDATNFLKLGISEEIVVKI